MCVGVVRIVGDPPGELLRKSSSAHSRCWYVPQSKAIMHIILDIGKKCKRYGVEKVFISALVISRRVNPNRIENLNKLIKEGCNLHDFVFIGYRNIKDEHLWKDGIHLQENGKVILAQNFIDFINHFLDQQRGSLGWT